MEFGCWYWIVLCMVVVLSCGEFSSMKLFMSFIDIVVSDFGIDVFEVDIVVIDSIVLELLIVNLGFCYGLEDGDLCDDQNVCIIEDVCEVGFCILGVFVMCDMLNDIGCMVIQCDFKDGCVQKVVFDGFFCEFFCYIEF